MRAEGSPAIRDGKPNKHTFWASPISLANTPWPKQNINQIPEVEREIPPPDGKGSKVTLQKCACIHEWGRISAICENNHAWNAYKTTSLVKPIIFHLEWGQRGERIWKNTSKWNLTHHHHLHHHRKLKTPQNSKRMHKVSPKVKHCYK